MRPSDGGLVSLQKLFALPDHFFAEVLAQVPDMSVGHRRVYDLGKPLIGLPLCHDPCLMELAELPVGLESENLYS